MILSNSTELLHNHHDEHAESRAPQAGNDEQIPYAPEIRRPAEGFLLFDMGVKLSPGKRERQHRTEYSHQERKKGGGTRREDKKPTKFLAACNSEFRSRHLLRNEQSSRELEGAEGSRSASLDSNIQYSDSN